MNICCSTVAFRKYPFEKALGALLNAGYEYLETHVSGPSFCPHADVDTYDPVKFKNDVKKFGFKGVTAVWMRAGNLVASEQCVEYAKRSLEWAKAAGVPVVIAGDGIKPANMSEEDAFNKIKGRLEEIIPLAEKNKVTFAIETHGTFSLTKRGLLRLLSISGSKYFGINYDTANVHNACVESMAAEGGKMLEPDGKDECEILEAIISRLVHFHAKDKIGKVCTVLGQGEVNVKGCIGILKKSGYGRTVSFETEGDEGYDEAYRLVGESYKFLKNIC